MKYHRYIGVDGCKAGWFYVGISRYGECDFGVFKTLPKLWQAKKIGALILIDIPIGLPSKEKPTRQCDRMARKLLSPLRHNSVFSPPCRDVLLAASYQDACQINKSIIGKKISIMAWGITVKIREADNLLKDHSKTRSVIRECHPEICFYGLNGSQPMEYYKKKPMGQEERLELLNGHYDKSELIFKAALDRFKRKDVARDDVIDALAAAVTGFLSRGNLTTLPDSPEIDEWRRPVEMVYFPVAPKIPEKAAQSGTAASGVISEMLGKSGSPEQVFPATELYNETWMLRLVMDWFARNEVPRHPLSFSKGCRWFSEGLIPTQFRPRFQKDKFGEARTHADCIVGHFHVGQKAKADIQLSPKATHFVCLEAKMFSKLSPGITNARYYNQAARYVACIAEMIRRVDRPPRLIKRLGFYVLAPEEQIIAGVFKSQLDAKNVHDTVKRRVSEYGGKKDQWFEQWFLPTLDRVKIKCLSWESIVSKISEIDPDSGDQLQSFYDKCLDHNKDKRGHKAGGRP